MPEPQASARVARATVTLTPWRQRLIVHARLTLHSLSSEGLHLHDSDVIDAVLRAGHPAGLRSRLTQMIRNHVAILLHLDQCIARQMDLDAATILRWFGSLCAGLPAPEISAAGLVRLEQVCRKLNSPSKRPSAAIPQIADLHHDLLNDPLFPSFNRVLARVLLQFHLRRAGLPLVLLPSAGSAQEIAQALTELTRRPATP